MSRFEKHRIRDARLPFIFHDYRFPIGKTANNNWHRNVELLCVADGSATIVTNGQSFSVGTGETVIVNTNCIHSVIAAQETHLYCLIVDREFCLENGFDTDCVSFSPHIRDRAIPKLLQRFAEVYRAASPYRILSLRALLLSLLTILCEHYSAPAAEPYRDSHLLGSIKQVIGYLDSQSHRPVTLAELASLVGMSESYLSRTFHRITGYTVIEYLNHVRCEHAKTLLAKQDMTVESVAYACGFANVSYFIRTFRALTELRPSEYRAQLRAETQVE